MSRTDFKTWMDRNGLNEIDVASLLKIHPNTVTRFLKGDPKMRRSTLAMFERLMTDVSAQPAATRAAHG